MTSRSLQPADLEKRIEALEQGTQSQFFALALELKRLDTVEHLANDLLNVCAMFQQALDKLVPIFDSIHENLNIQDERLLEQESALDSLEAWRSAVGAGNLASAGPDYEDTMS